MKYTHFIILILIISSCVENLPAKKKADPIIEGGQCVYGKYKEVAYVSNYKIDENDSLIEVNFTFVNKPPTGLLRLRHKLIKERGKDLLNAKTVKDTSIRYIIEGTKIIKGSCYPYFIDNVSLKKE